MKTWFESFIYSAFGVSLSCEKKIKKHPHHCSFFFPKNYMPSYTQIPLKANASQNRKHSQNFLLLGTYCPRDRLPVGTLVVLGEKRGNMARKKAAVGRKAVWKEGTAQCALCILVLPV